MNRWTFRERRSQHANMFPLCGVGPGRRVVLPFVRQRPERYTSSRLPGYRQLSPAIPVAYTGPQETSGKATASLICGIVAYVILPFFAAIPAIILGAPGTLGHQEKGGPIERKWPCDSGHGHGLCPGGAPSGDFDHCRYRDPKSVACKDGGERSFRSGRLA